MKTESFRVPGSRVMPLLALAVPAVCGGKGQVDEAQAAVGSRADAGAFSPRVECSQQGLRGRRVAPGLRQAAAPDGVRGLARRLRVLQGSGQAAVRCDRRWRQSPRCRERPRCKPVVRCAQLRRPPQLPLRWEYGAGRDRRLPADDLRRHRERGERPLARGNVARVRFAGGRLRRGRTTSAAMPGNGRTRVPVRPISSTPAALAGAQPETPRIACGVQRMPMRSSSGCLRISVSDSAAAHRDGPLARGLEGACTPVAPPRHRVHTLSVIERGRSHAVAQVMRNP